MVTVLPQVSRLGEIALDILFPRYCVGCRKEGSFICDSCLRSQPLIAPPVCPLCGRPQASGILCSDCIRWKADIDGIRSPFRFEGVIQQAVYQLKYRNLRSIAPMLAGFLDHFKALSGRPVCPAHDQRDDRDHRNHGRGPHGLCGRGHGPVCGAGTP